MCIITNIRKRIRVRPVIKAVIITVSLLGVYIFVDYNNMPTKIGLSVRNMNTDLFGIIVGSLTGIFVFICSYIFVEQWNIEKNNNMKQLAYMLIIDTYNKSREIYDYINEGMLETLSTEFDSRGYTRTSLVEKIKPIPFDNENVILQFATQGAIAPEVLMDYYKVKSEFSHYCSTKIIFYDIPDIIAPPLPDYMQVLNNARSKIEKKLEEVQNHAHHRKTI